MKIKKLKTKAVIELESKQEVEAFAGIVEVYMDAVYEGDGDARDVLVEKLDEKFN